MMIRGDQHVDDWVEIAVDYLDGQVDQETRLAIEAHLAGCPLCAEQLRRQQYVVSFLQETLLDDPPEDLEYRAIGEIVFPSPGTEPAIRPVEEKQVYRTPRWYRTLRPWIPAAAFVVLLFAAVVGYGIARSGSGGEQVAGDSSRMAISTTAAAAATSTPMLGEAAPGGAAASAASDSVTTAAGATTTAGSPPTADTGTMNTFVATAEPKEMIRALEIAQAPTYVAFRSAVTNPSTATSTSEQAIATTTTAAAGGVIATTATTTATVTTAAPATTDTTTAAADGTYGTLTVEQATALMDEIKQFTGLDPVDRTLWIDGPTFAVFLPRQDAAELVDLVRSISSAFGLVVSIEGTPPSHMEKKCTELLAQKTSFPVLEASRALQPSTWDYDFTTSTLGGVTKSLPDADGSHVIVVIWMAE